MCSRRVKRSTTALLENSINPERVRRLLVHHHSDFAMILEMATCGAVIDEPKGVSFDSHGQIRRKVRLKLPNSILMHVNKFLGKGDGIRVEIGVVEAGRQIKDLLL
jgi:hypothetical protein